ncbi:putative Cysteine rich repeat protein [Gammaproteobacteria bacterium]
MKLSSPVVQTLLFSVLLGTWAPETLARPGPCAEDVEKLCGEVSKSDARALAFCMKNQIDKASPSCKAYREERRTQRKALLTACEKDINLYCPGLQKKPLAQCLKTHRVELSEPCTQAIISLKPPKRRF